MSHYLGAVTNFELRARIIILRIRIGLLLGLGLSLGWVVRLGLGLSAGLGLRLAFQLGLWIITKKSKRNKPYNMTGMSTLNLDGLMV